MRLCVGLIVLAPVSRWMIVAGTGNGVMAFASLIGCADTLAAGALLAILVRSNVSPRALWRTCVALACASGATLTYVVGSFGYGNYWSPRYYMATPNLNILLYTLLATLFASVIGITVLQSGFWTRILTNRALRHIGKISCGLYIYHWPILNWWPALAQRIHIVTGTEHGADRIVILLTEWGLTYAVTLASWRFLEMPILGLKRRFSAVSEPSRSTLVV